MNHERFFQSKGFRYLLCGLGGLAVAFLVFQGGAYVGARKASFACNWAENYAHNFGEGPAWRGDGWGAARRGPGGRPGMSGHGVFGAVLSVQNTTIAVRDKDDVEREIVVNDDTVIKRGPDAIAITDLKPGDQVMAFGSPDESGRVAATLIRVLPDWPRQSR